MTEAAELRALLAARFARTVGAGGAGDGSRPSGWPPLAVPAALRETIVGAQRLRACPPALIDYYTDRMPALLVEQLRPDDAARALLWRPLALERLPRLAVALAGVFAQLADAGLDGRALTGEPTVAALLAARPTVAALYAHTVFGSGLPLLGAYPGERVLLAEELLRGDPDAVIDLRLSGNLVHELCHGPQLDGDEPPAPWMLLEAAAIHLGAQARPEHVFPATPGEAVPGVSLFVLVAQALARRFGRRALWSLVVGCAVDEAFGARAGSALATAGWQDWLARQEPPFARDALDAMAWVKLADAARGRSSLDALLDGIEDPFAAALSRPLLLTAAAAQPWRALPGWSEPSTDEDIVLLEGAVDALFQVNRLAPTFQTHPAELPPGGRLCLDVEAATLSAERRPDGVFGEPAWWLVPPPLARRLAERGAQRVRIEGATRQQRREIAGALTELVLGAQPLAAETVLAWTSSR